jgi:hypothetical protein
MIHSNNPLAVKHETENDTACLNLRYLIFFRMTLVEAAAFVGNKRIFSNDQNVEAYRLRGVAFNRLVGDCGLVCNCCFGAGANRRTARGDQVAVPQ